jgi:hypothetical protein
LVEVWVLLQVADQRRGNEVLAAEHALAKLATDMLRFVLDPGVEVE